jgi:hypothetical protein
MKKLLFGLGFLALACASFVYLGHKETQFSNADFRVAEDDYFNQLKFNKVNGMFNKANSESSLAIVEALYLGTLDEVAEARMGPYVTLKKASLLFNQGEYYLHRAEEIEFSLSSPPKPAGPPDVDPENPNVEPIAAPNEQRKYHPLTIQMLQKATDSYEAARKEVDKLSENTDIEFNFGMNYLKGEIYYRFLEFMSDSDTAQELFNQTLNYYKIALRHKPGDINTVVNIEILIKNQNDFLSNASNPQVKRKQMLNVRKAGLGSSKGN